MRTFKNDYNFGVKKELEVLKIIKDKKEKGSRKDI